jgi:hypothetical protein
VQTPFVQRSLAHSALAWQLRPASNAAHTPKGPQTPVTQSDPLLQIRPGEPASAQVPLAVRHAPEQQSVSALHDVLALAQQLVS